MLELDGLRGFSYHPTLTAAAAADIRSASRSALEYPEGGSKEMGAVWEKILLVRQ